jgi:hypothetical protein
MSMTRRSLSAVLRLLVGVGILGVLAAAYWQRQSLYDWWRLRDYEPAAEIVALADNAAMNAYGRKLFYVHKPELNSRKDFNQNCSGYEQTIVLGCYITHRNIYIFDVTDTRLEGIEEVTAAHEMLHAAYDRLSQAERTRVDGLTTSYFAQIADSRLKSVVKSYEDRNASVVPNELHSILATEVRALPAELEHYYAKYFTNRKAVVDYSEQYEAVFTQQQQHIESLAQRIDQLNTELKSERFAIEQLENVLSADAERLEQLKREGDIAAYNTGVPEYNQKVGHYQYRIKTYNTNVQLLNSLVEEHNQLAVEQKQLIDAITSQESQIE